MTRRVGGRSPDRSRRRWSAEEKARIVEETLAPGARVSEVARRWQVCPQQVFGWRRAACQDVKADRGADRVRRSALFRSSAKSFRRHQLPRAAPAAPVIEVKLAGAVVRVSGMDDAAQLTAVLRAVRASAITDMINVPAGARVLLATRPVDFRKGCTWTRRAGAGSAGGGSVFRRGHRLPRQAQRPGEDIGLGYAAALSWSGSSCSRDRFAGRRSWTG